jgi:hypothetical protein
LPKAGGARAAPALDVSHPWLPTPSRVGVCSRLERCAHERNRNPVRRQFKQPAGNRSKRADQVRLPSEDSVFARTGSVSVIDDLYNARSHVCLVLGNGTESSSCKATRRPSLVGPGGGGTTKLLVHGCAILTC